MGAGGPGDHPFSDIVTHGMTVVGYGVDDEIRDLVRRRPDLRGDIASFLLEVLPTPRQAAQQEANRIKSFLVSIETAKGNDATMTDQSPLEDLRARVPTLKDQLTKWGIRVVIAYVLARLLIAWQGGPEWLMTVVYIYIAISFLMSVGLWLYGQNAVRKMAEQLNSVEND